MEQKSLIYFSIFEFVTNEATDGEAVHIVAQRIFIPSKVTNLNTTSNELYYPP